MLVGGMSYLTTQVPLKCNSCHFVQSAGQHSSGGEVTGEEGPATEPEPVTYILKWTFSHTSYRISHAPATPIAPYVPVTGVPQTATTLRLAPSRLDLVQ